MSSRPVESVPCKFCPQVMRYSSHLREHYYQKHFYCLECDGKYENREEMIDHLTNSHGQTLRCEFCKYNSLRQREIQVHINKIHPEFGEKKETSPAKKRKNSDPPENTTNENPSKKMSALENIDCPFCGFKFKFTNELIEHYRDLHYFCQECNKTLLDRFEMLEHLEKIHQINTQCEFCTFTSMRETDIESHVRKCHNSLDGDIENTKMDLRKFQDENVIEGLQTINQENRETELKTALQSSTKTKIQCSFCHHKTTSLDFLIEHSYIFHYHCMECGYTFKNQDDILDHLAVKHYLRVKCVLCQFKTFRPLKMDCHIQKCHIPGPNMKKRDLDKELICQYCDVEATDQLEFEAHMNEIHNYCPPCDIAFKDIKEVVSHIFSLHARDVECSYCDFVSFQSEKLEAHISRHHKSEPRRDDAEKFLFCKFCKQKLQNKTELKEHCFKTHKFCCDCDLNFKNQVDLQQHIRHKHQNMMTCDLCPFFTFHYDQWIAHLKLFHSNNFEEQEPSEKILMLEEIVV